LRGGGFCAGKEPLSAEVWLGDDSFLGGPKNLTSAKERLQGYRDALAEAGLPVDPALIQMGNFHVEGGYTAVQALLKLPNRVTAIFAANDLMAIGALRGIAARGLRVPEDVAVVGFDDIALAMYTEPPLTTVKQPVREIGKLATELIMARVNGERKEPQSRRLKTSLIVRGSCGIKVPAHPRPKAKQQQLRSAKVST
jgi:LacI family transcriptional regulator